MVKAVARAFRWREMLETGTHATIAEIAAADKINDNETYVGRVLRLTLPAPDIVEKIQRRQFALLPGFQYNRHSSALRHPRLLSFKVARM
jgi:hypothetical protein